MINKLHFFGFSVTRYGNPTFVGSFASKNLNIPSVSFSAIGGISFDVLPYIVNKILPEELDCLVLEVGTSHYSLGSHREVDVDNILFALINELYIKGIRRVIFMMLPRYDLPVPCLIMQSLLRNQDLLGYGILDLQSSFRDSWSQYAVDIVHPNQDGVEYISDKLGEYLTDELVSSLELKSILGKNSRSGLMVISNTINRNNYPLLVDFESSNIGFTFPQLEVGERLSYTADLTCTMNGILFLMGPDTASLVVECDDWKTTCRTYDQHSYYYRIGFRSFTQNVISGKKIYLESIAERNNIQLIRPSRYKNNRILNYPIAFAYTIK